MKQSDEDVAHVEAIGARLAPLFNGERLVQDTNPTCITIYTDFLKEIGKEEMAEDGPDADFLIHELNLTEQQFLLDNPGTVYKMPGSDFFFGIGYLAYQNPSNLDKCEELQAHLLEFISDKVGRSYMLSTQFSWCVMLLEKLAWNMDREGTSTEFIEMADQLLNATFYYMYEWTDTRFHDIKPMQMVMDNALRLMKAACKVAYRPKFWPAHLRIVVDRMLRVRELPFTIQDTCYKLTCQAAWILGPRFWSNDEQFLRVVAALVSVHWRLMLEGLADREPLENAYQLFIEIFLICEERNRISDQAAICVASNCKDMLESVAGYIKGEAENPEVLRDGQRLIVASLMSTLVSTGAFQMINEDDERVIVDWWLKHSIAQSDMFRQLMLCSTCVKKLDTRVMSALAAYYERCVTGDVPEEESDMMVLAWIMKLIQEKRTDFYDKASLSECVARLERVRTPKKYVDALKRLKC